MLIRFVLIAGIWLCTLLPAHADPVSIGTAVAAFGSWYASIGIVGQTLVQLGASLVFSAAAVGISYLLSGAGQQQAQATQDTQGTPLPEFDALLEVVRAYGTATVAGGVFFHKTVASPGSGSPDRWVFGLTLSEGICDGLVSISINGVECFFGPDGNAVTAPWFDGSVSYLKVSFRRGTDDQAIDPIIAARFPVPPDDFYPDDPDRVTKWAEFRQRGVCTLVLDAAYGNDAEQHSELWGVAGVPQLLVRLRGLRAYDRTDAGQDPDDPTTWTWSDTATVCIEDYLCAEIGGQVARDAIDDAAARESIAFDRDYMATLDGSEQRGRINGVVRAADSPLNALQNMLLQNRGQIGRAAGLYTIRADRPAAAVATIHQAQWLPQGAIQQRNEPDIRAGISGVVVQHYPAIRYGQSAETAYPASALDDPEATRITLPFCDSTAAAQRLGFAMMAENAIGRTISGSFDASVLVATGKPNRLLERGDVVNWYALAPYDDMNGLAKVDDVMINSDFSVTLSLIGADPDVISGWSVALETPLEDAA